MTEYITIDGFENLTEQEIFDMAYIHVNKNGKPSISKVGQCKYGGIGCAASVFLKPEYREAMDSTDFEYGSDWGELARLNKVPSYHKELISKLQFAHDFPARETADGEKFLTKFNEQMNKLSKNLES